MNIPGRLLIKYLQLLIWFGTLFVLIRYLLRLVNDMETEIIPVEVDEFDFDVPLSPDFNEPLDVSWLNQFRMKALGSIDPTAKLLILMNCEVSLEWPFNHLFETPCIRNLRKLLQPTRTDVDSGIFGDSFSIICLLGDFRYSMRSLVSSFIYRIAVAENWITSRLMLIQMNEKTFYHMVKFQRKPSWTMYHWNERLFYDIGLSNLKSAILLNFVSQMFKIDYNSHNKKIDRFKNVEFFEFDLDTFREFSSSRFSLKALSATPEWMTMIEDRLELISDNYLKALSDSIKNLVYHGPPQDTKRGEKYSILKHPSIALISLNDVDETSESSCKKLLKNPYLTEQRSLILPTFNCVSLNCQLWNASRAQQLSELIFLLKSHGNIGEIIYVYVSNLHSGAWLHSSSHSLSLFSDLLEGYTSSSSPGNQVLKTWYNKLGYFTIDYCKNFRDTFHKKVKSNYLNSNIFHHVAGSISFCRHINHVNASNSCAFDSLKNYDSTHFCNMITLRVPLFASRSKKFVHLFNSDKISNNIHLKNDGSYNDLFTVRFEMNKTLAKFWHSELQSYSCIEQTEEMLNASESLLPQFSLLHGILIRLNFKGNMYKWNKNTRVSVVWRSRKIDGKQFKIKCKYLTKFEEYIPIHNEIVDVLHPIDVIFDIGDHGEIYYELEKIVAVFKSP